MHYCEILGHWIWKHGTKTSKEISWITYSENSVQFSHSVMSDSLRPHGLQHTRLACPSPTPRDYSNSCPSHQWCHPTISSSVVTFSSHLQSFPTSGSFPMSWFFASRDQSIGVSASASILPVLTVASWPAYIFLRRQVRWSGIPISLRIFHSSLWST